MQRRPVVRQLGHAGLLDVARDPRRATGPGGAAPAGPPAAVLGSCTDGLTTTSPATWEPCSSASRSASAPPIDSPPTNTVRAAAAQVARTPASTSAYQSGQRVWFISCQVVPCPGSRGSDTVTPSPARCSAQAARLRGAGEAVAQQRRRPRPPSRCRLGAQASPARVHRALSRRTGVDGRGAFAAGARAPSTGSRQSAGARARQHGRERRPGVLLGGEGDLARPDPAHRSSGRGSRAASTSRQTAARSSPATTCPSPTLSSCPLVVPRRVTFLAKSDYFTGRGVKGRLTAGFFRGVGQVPIDRVGRQGAEAALRTGLRVLGEGTCSASTPRAPAARRPPLPRQDRRRPDGAGGAASRCIPVVMIDTASAAARPEDARTSAASASGSASRWTSPATRGWRTTGSSCARSPTRSCTR